MINNKWLNSNNLTHPTFNSANIPRHLGACIYFNDAIWLIGGKDTIVNEDTNDNENNELPWKVNYIATIEIYNVTLNQWFVSNFKLQYPRANPRVINVANTQIWIIGGYGRRNRDYSQIEIIYPLKNQTQYWHFRKQNHTLTEQTSFLGNSDELPEICQFCFFLFFCDFFFVLVLCVCCVSGFVCVCVCVCVCMYVCMYFFAVCK